MKKAKLNQTYEGYLKQETRKSTKKWAKTPEIPLPEFHPEPKTKIPLFKKLLIFKP